MRAFCRSTPSTRRSFSLSTPSHLERSSAWSSRRREGRFAAAATGVLTFEAPDWDAFPCLGLAIQAGKDGGTAPCVLNAADEVAVEAFLAGSIPYPAIAEVVERVLEELPALPVAHFDDLFAAD